MPRGILFDKDGTLIDFNATWLPAYRLAAERASAMAGDARLTDRLLASGGFNAATGTWKPRSLLTSASNDEIVDAWMAQAGIAEREPFASIMLDTFHEAAVASPVCIGGIPEMIAEMYAMGYTLGVATMDDERTARDSLARVGIDAWLSFVCGADSGHGIKPGPGMLEAFCRHTGLTPPEVIMVGDSPYDIEMGRAAGAGIVVGVTSGSHSAADLAAADHVLDDATGLLALLTPRWASA